MKKYIGVSFVRAPRSLKCWRAAIVRKNVTINLGHFTSAEIAADAYDNAAHFLKKWENSAALYNFPEKEHETPYPGTITALDRLRQRFPEFEASLARQEKMGENERLVDEATHLIDTVARAMRQLGPIVATLAGKLRIAEANLKAADELTEKQARIIDGLRAGGQQLFTKIEGKTQQVTAVEAQLGS